MNTHPRVLLCLALILLAAGCATQPKPVDSPPGAPLQEMTATLAVAPDAGEALRAAALEVRGTRIYVDVIPVMELRDGMPLINTAHAAEAGRAAMAALQEAFLAHGFQSPRGEFTSIGLGAAPRNILLTSGAEAPVPGTTPVILSPALEGTQRAPWIKGLYGAVHDYAVRGTADTTLAATYLSPNLSRIEFFAVLSGGEGPVARISAVAFDSRTGRALWSGHAAETASVLDIAVATSLARRLAATLPTVAAPGN